jgi:hypothetical protein
MAIPRAWLGQQGMLTFMESLSDLKLEEEERSHGTDSGNSEKYKER